MCGAIRSRMRRAATLRQTRRLAAALALAGAISVLPGHRQPAAQSLACGDPGPRSWRFRWRAPPVTFSAARYVLLRGPAVTGGLGERVDIAVAIANADGIIVADVGGFDPMLAWDVALLAVSEQGADSAPSNRLTIPAQISGECAPPAPTLLDYSATVAAAAAQLERDAGELRESAQELHDRLQREVQSR